MMRRLVLWAALAVAPFVRADVLFWQLNEDSLTSLGEFLDGDATVTYARLMAGDVYGYGEGLGYAAVNPSVPSLPMDIAAADLTVLPSGGSAQSFYIEIYQFVGGESVCQAFSEMVSYESLKEFMAGSMMTTNIKAWGGGSFHAAPEPTSGLMVLMGLAVLGLRRKRA